MPKQKLFWSTPKARGKRIVEAATARDAAEAFADEFPNVPGLKISVWEEGQLEISEPAYEICNG